MKNIEKNIQDHGLLTMKCDNIINIIYKSHFTWDPGTCDL